MAITREAVWTVADDLHAKGVKPTLNAVRKKLGAGSFTTISDAMSAWKERQRVKAQPTVDPLPTELAEAAGNLVEELWVAARHAADRALTGEREHMQAEHAELLEQASDAAELADNLTDETEGLRQQLAEAQARADEEAEGLRQQLAKAQVRADECDRLTRELSALEERLAAEIQKATELAQRKAIEATEARKSERAALDRAGRAEGQAEALKDQLAQLTDALRKPRPGKSA